jgi:hypothetical protein
MGYSMIGWFIAFFELIMDNIRLFLILNGLISLGKMWIMGTDRLLLGFWFSHCSGPPEILSTVL